MADVVRAYQHKSFDSLKRYYRSLDLFLIDDMQFFVGKSRTQEEFFYMFNSLFEAHKQVVITSDSFPKEIDRHRGAADLALRLGPHGRGRAARARDARGHPAQEGARSTACALDESVAFFIAKHIRSNVRELEGALKRVLAYARFNNARGQRHARAARR